jgi:penicillin amidase
MNIVRGIMRLLLGRRLPVTRGTLRVAGLGGPVVIRRDRWGIPAVEAERGEDAWFGLGFCHGQDRAFQIEQLHRVVRGTVSALVGPAALPLDRLSRRIGFAFSAEQQWEILDAEVKAMLEAYVRGVNGALERGARRPAPEFALLGARPSVFEPADTLGILKLLSFSLASNWDIELARLKVFTEDGAAAVEALDPAYPEWQPLTSPPGAAAGRAVDRLAEELALLAGALGGGGGASNNWVIAGAKTATGRPILANDPHLPPTLPPYWYLASLSAPGVRLAGASFIGTPAFPAGHNGSVAWGITAGMVDNTDFFVEEPGPDGKSVREGGRFVPCPVREEVIEVKGGEAVREHVIVTPRGPIVGPALEGEKAALSLCAVWLQPRPVRGMFFLHRVKSGLEFRSLFAQWPGLPLNFVWADVSGAVGWQLAGETPQRRKGHGLAPLAGSDPEAGWDPETVSFEKMPHLENPAAGFIATANNRPVREDDGPFLGADWIDGYRAARLAEALQAKNDWDLRSVGELQTDRLSLPWRELRDAILAVATKDEDADRALNLLRAWDGVMESESPAASVFELFLVEMAQRLAKAKAPKSWPWALGQCPTSIVPFSMLAIRRFGHLVRLLHARPDGWFTRSWNEEISDALAAVARALVKKSGKDDRRWAWGRVRPLTLKHPLGEHKPLDKIFNLGPFAWGGDCATVAQAASDLLDPCANPLFIASLRMALDVGNWDDNRFVLPGGQSGNPFSPHYRDLFELWRRGQGVPIAWSKEKVEAAAVLRLEKE